MTDERFLDEFGESLVGHHFALAGRTGCGGRGLR